MLKIICYFNPKKNLNMKSSIKYIVAIKMKFQTDSLRFYSRKVNWWFCITAICLAIKYHMQSTVPIQTKILSPDQIKY